MHMYIHFQSHVTVPVNKLPVVNCHSCKSSEPPDVPMCTLLIYTAVVSCYLKESYWREYNRQKNNTRLLLFQLHGAQKK